MTAISSSIFLYLYASNKRSTYKEYKGKESVHSQDTISEYFSKNEKIPKDPRDINRKINTKRNINIGIFATVLTVTNGLISILFAFT